MTINDSTIAAFCDNSMTELVDLIKSLCLIAAPMGQERERALFCRDWLIKNGAKTAFVDEADNAVFEYGGTPDGEISVFMAHTDTVFPDTKGFDAIEENGTLRCPGVCDDTANLAQLLMAVKFLISHGFTPSKGLLIAANSGEEGLGNLKGSRHIMLNYGKRVRRLISFDGTYNKISNDAVGSSRYRVSIKTKGGHSFNDFGNENAIAQLSQIINDLYRVSVPDKENSKTTYNVGLISGGTSVNTIAQDAEMLYEYRSNSAECLAYMEAKFNEIIDLHRAAGKDISVSTLGTRPCMEGVDPAEQAALTAACAEIIKNHTGITPSAEASSTDCNIPLSMGVPAVSFGACVGHGAHTREEWLELSSLRSGMEIAIKTILKFAQ